MKQEGPESISQNLQSATEILSALLRRAVRRAYRSEEEEADLKQMKEMTAILKDLTGVMGQWKPPEEESCTGVVLLPREGEAVPGEQEAPEEQP